MPEKDGLIYEFGDFRLDPESPSLWRAGKLVSSPPKAVETLVQLVSAGGEIVSRETLLETVWKDTFVEEGNINYTISLLRKTLGDKGVIQTVPRRGYRFTDEVRKVSSHSSGGDSIAVPFRRRSTRWKEAAILIVSILLLTSLTIWLWNSPSVTDAEQSIRSLAVLPLTELNGTQESDPFSLGVTDLLIARLGSLDRFSVRPIDTVISFGESEDDPVAFAAGLKSDAVFTGTFRRGNGRVQVNARLLDVRSGAQIWSAQFDEAETDIFILQEKLARTIALSIAADLSEKDQRLLAKRNTESTEAYKAYVRGRAIFDQKDPAKPAKAALEFQRAIAIDPTYSLAYSGLADALSRQGNQATGPEAQEFYSKARSYARRAMDLDPDSPEAHVASARIKRLADWDWAGAEQDFRKAIALNPNHADAHLFYGQMLGFLGRFEESSVEIERAISINPISVPAIGSRLALLESKGDNDAALRLANEYRNSAPENPNALRALGTFSLHKGDYDTVIEIGHDVLAKNGGPKWAWYSLMAAAYQRSNDDQRAAEMLALLDVAARSDTKALYSLAMNYAEFGRRDEAIGALEKCFAMHEERMVWINVEPRFATLRDDTRFQELVRRMNFSL